MKEFSFEMKINQYKIDDWVFNDNFTYDEIMLMQNPKTQDQVLNILNVHMDEGTPLTGAIVFKRLGFISNTIIKCFLEDMEKL